MSRKNNAKRFEDIHLGFNRILINIGIYGDPHHISSAIICSRPISAEFFEEEVLSRKFLTPNTDPAQLRGRTV